MDLLVLGGGVFLGASIVDAALARGHRVTVFNRGRARSVWPAGVEVVVGDRTRDLALLAGRRFDAAIDTCGYVPADVRASAAALAGVGRYCFVSSVSAYATFAHAPVVESDALASSDGIAEDDRTLDHYGAPKAACERVVERAFGARALVVRPGLIVGPRDRTGRFSYWPWRALAGGEMLVPDVPPPAAIQVIDVRDLAEWTVRAVEDGRTGAYNATGPQRSVLDWPTLVETCIVAARRRDAPPLAVVPMSESFLLASGVAPWSELPLWVPSNDPEQVGFDSVDCSRAVAAGLATRPLLDTVDAVLDEARGLVADDPRQRNKLGRTREAELIARWREQSDETQRGAAATIEGER